ncbi:MAG TPA: CPBP family intramembrane glutamic endopeptidase [Chloroflexia bacterium]|nr:CPBP family intramembrane glutamic endopeptidase [Chloroflexia bacterium]
MVEYTSAAPPVAPRAQAPIAGWQLGLSLLLLLVITIGGSLLGGEAGGFAQAGLTVVPFAGLALLAYLGQERIWALVLALLALAGIVLLYAAYGIVLSFMALEGSAALEPRQLNLSGAHLGQLALITSGLLLLAPLAGGLTALPAVRAWVSRRLPIDPHSFVHALALATVVTLLLIGFIPLLVLGAPPILSVLTGPGGDKLLGDTDAGSQLRQQFYQLVWTIPCAVLAVGYGVRRNLGDALARLGLVRPTMRQVALALGLAVAAVIGALLLDQAINTVWGALGWPVTNQDAFAQLMSFAISPLGAVVVGVSAGLGEELAVRGVLQPRLGILLSNLLFTSLHAFQYNWDGLLSVFLLGLVMGLVRRRTNTTTSAIVHGSYDAILVMLSVYSIGT